MRIRIQGNDEQKWKFYWRKKGQYIYPSDVQATGEKPPALKNEHLALRKIHIFYFFIYNFAQPDPDQPNKINADPQHWKKTN